MPEPIADSFKIIAVQTHDKSESKHCKVLEINKTYYFMSDYAVSDPGSDPWIKEPEHWVNVYGNKDKETKIEVSAVVGENGSGKSSLIELMIRAINNLACMVLGEYRTSLSADNLLYVDDLYAALFFVQGNRGYVLRVEGPTVCVYELTKEKTDSCIYDKQRLVFSRSQEEEFTKEGAKIYTPLQKRRKEGPEDIKMLSNLFYTVVTNYSLYAYNPADIRAERSNVEKVRAIYKEGFEEFRKNDKRAIRELEKIKDRIDKVEYGGSKALQSAIRTHCLNDISRQIQELQRWPTDEEHFWLRGMFFKNDGYSTPIVLSPFRHKGNIDVNSEAYLSHRRLFALLAYKNDKNEYPFRAINNKVIRQVELSFGKDKMFAEWQDIFTESNLRLDHLAPEVKLYVYRVILNYYRAKIGTDKSAFTEQQYLRALRYLVHKTLKISRNYTSLGYLFRLLNNEELEWNESSKRQLRDAIKQLVDHIILDNSHIGQRVRKTLVYLKLGHWKAGKYDLTNPEDKKSFDYIVEPKNYDRRQTQITVTEDYTWKFSQDDLLPPALFDIELKLYEVADKAMQKEPILFSSLSSGERQQIYFTHSVLYHLINLDSVHRNYSKDEKPPLVPTYHSACVVFEEIELYFHPERQRNLVNHLIESIRSAGLNALKYVHMVFVTHSPFILSDIPAKNCLFLRKGVPLDQKTEAIPETFGANIHDLLCSSFFLEEGTKGAFAQSFLNRVAVSVNYEYFKKRVEQDEGDTAAQYFYERAAERQKEIETIEREKLRGAVKLIDEPIIKGKLTEMLDVCGL